jgi:DNA repair ATPase RecN
VREEAGLRLQHAIDIVEARRKKVTAKVRPLADALDELIEWWRVARASSACLPLLEAARAALDAPHARARRKLADAAAALRHARRALLHGARR